MKLAEECGNGLSSYKKSKKYQKNFRNHLQYQFRAPATLNSTIGEPYGKNSKIPRSSTGRHSGCEYDPRLFANTNSHGQGDAR